MSTGMQSGTRVRPTALAGLGAFLLYVAIILAAQGTSGIPYDDLAASTENIWRSGILSIALGGAAVAVLTVWFGWWRAAMIETRRSRRRWALIVPAIYVAIAAGSLVVSDWGALEIGFLLSVLLLSCLVGFAEELTCRGALLVGLRGTMREVAVWLTTCVLFGLMHGVNLVFGAAVGDTLQQMLLAGMQGSAFYILRRLTGTLVWAMALHALWDFSVFTNAAGDAGPNILALLIWPTAILAVVAGFFVARDVGRSSRGAETSPEMS